MKKTILLLLLAVMIAPLANAQKKVLGTVTYSYKIVGEGSEAMAGMMPNKMMVKYSENYVGVEISGGMMTAMLGKTVVNGETGESYMIKDAEKTIYLIDQEDTEEQLESMSKPVVTEFSDIKEIAGYKCKKYTQELEVQGMKMTQTIWATKKLVQPDYKAKSMQGMAGYDMLNSEIDGFPMLIEIAMPGTAMTMEMKVTGIDFGKIADKEFAKPKGYEEKPMSELKMF